MTRKSSLWVRRFSFVLQGLAMVILLAGCASFGKTIKNFLNGKSDDKPQVPVVTTPRFSEQENLRFQSDRKYRRTNRRQLEDEAGFAADAGSLWVMEGQGAYLFAQNQIRMVGDLLNVKVEGGPRNQLQTKVRVIAKLLERLEGPSRTLASVPPRASTTNSPTDSNNQNPDNSASQANSAQVNGGESPSSEVDSSSSKSDVLSGVQVVPTRIVELLKDGSYRVRGVQPFMIGRREYKVIVTGIVRPEDFDEAGINASKLLDSQFDIVSSRKGATL